MALAGLLEVVLPASIAEYLVFVGVEDVLQRGEVQLVAVQFWLLLVLHDEQVDDVLDFGTGLRHGFNLAKKVPDQREGAGSFLLLECADCLGAVVNASGQHLA